MVSCECFLCHLSSGIHFYFDMYFCFLVLPPQGGVDSFSVTAALTVVPVLIQILCLYINVLYAAVFTVK